MEPYKFEEDIKNKLEKRTINPTAKSWNTLQDSLAFKERKKGSKVWFLFGIAASIVGVLFVVSIFFKNDTIKTNTPTVVDAPIFDENDTSTSIATENNSNLDTLQSTDTLDKTINNIITNNSKETISTSTVKLVRELADAKKGILQNTEKEAVITVLNSEKDSVFMSIEDKEIEVLLTKIDDLKTKTYKVTDSDVDALLKDAQLALELEKLYEENAKTVDAFKLLQDVEADIDKSIRVKFLETLKLNYENIKTLIAQRND